MRIRARLAGHLRGASERGDGGRDTFAVEFPVLLNAQLQTTPTIIAPGSAISSRRGPLAVASAVHERLRVRPNLHARRRPG